MANPNTVLMRPICIGKQVVETVKTYKLLGVTIREDLKQNSHVDCVIAKAAKRLIGQNVLKRERSKLYNYPECTAYNQALLEAKVSSLANRRVSLCRRFVCDVASYHKNHSSFPKLKQDLSVIIQRTINKLRRTKRADEFFTL